MLKNGFEQVRSDVAYTIRWLLRSPGFAAVAILSLAVGIGFNTALFSLVDALLLRGLPVERADRLVDVYTRGADGDTYATSSYPDFLDFREQNRVFGDMLGYSPAIAAVQASDQARMMLGEIVTGNYFQLLGVRAAVGRTLLPDDDRPGATRAAVISYRMWMRDFAGDPSTVGRSLRLRGQLYTIVGVAPREFTGMVPLLQPEMWIPLAWVEEVEPAGIQDVVPSPTGATRLERRGQRWLFVKGRLNDGESAQTAEANLQVIARQLEAAHPQTNTRRSVSVVENVRLHPEADRMLKPVAAGLMVAVGLVLLVACANVTNMLLARASARQREIGIRLAIGAGRGRLVRQLLTESLLLAFLGAGAGAAVAALLLRVFEAVPAPLDIPISVAAGLDGRVLLFAIGLAAVAGLLAGLAPALRATRPNLASEMKGDAPSVAGAGRRWTLRDGLVVLQTAVTLVLLVGAGLLTRSILEARRIDVGFNTKGVAVLATEVGLIGYDDARARQFFDRGLERIRAIPGVESASLTVRQPLAINFNRSSIFFPDRQQPGDEAMPIASTWVDDSYFATLGVPLLGGRNFSTIDTPASPRTAVVNEAFVRTYWPGGDALHKRFRLRTADGPEIEIVGIVGDYKVDTVGERPRPYIHYAAGQRTFTGMVFIARGASDAAALLNAMRREVLALEPQAVFLEARTMASQVDATLLPVRLAAQSAAVTALVATMLAAVGLYGVIAYGVARRTREIGIRMALGSAPGRVIGMVMRQGFTLAGIGLVAGLAIAALASRALAAALYGVSAYDPLAWAAAAAVSLGSAAVANLIPARRASKVDPSIALRAE